MNDENIYALPVSVFERIQNLSARQLKAIRRNIREFRYNDDQTRDAIGQYVADGGNIEDLLDEEGHDETEAPEIE